ncbi:YafY family protein [Geomicrobium sp. JCM 19038]|uniref:helix-turn-helix transcriptional regulator n=1 Tax=Geomicrobium sp. JCM 19038 TaxID=1460635 RepID=UPI00187C5DBD|nr:YafY family protein [Geomicrobium sp. JCM 19038]
MERLLGIIIHLMSTNKLITATELSKKFEVSVRTIYRDIDLVSQAGIPIASHPGMDGGFQIMESFSINKQSFSLEDLSAVYHLLTEVGTSQFQSISDKIAVIQPMVKKEDNKILMSMSHSKKERSTIELWLHAINQNRVISMNYTDAKAKQSCREVEPRNLLLEGSKWYGEAYCLKKNAERIFLLSRINEITLLDRHFEVRSKVQPDNSKRNEYLHLRFTNDEEVKRRVVEQFEDIRTDDEHINVYAPLYDHNYAISVILSYGSNVEIIAPKEIRMAFLEELRRMNTLYFKGENKR